MTSGSQSGFDGRQQRRWVTAGMLAVSSVPQRALLRVLAFSDQRQLDAAPLVRALAGDYPGSYGQRLLQLASALEAGVPVIDAVGQTPGVMDRSSTMALRLANESSALPEMYDALLGGNTITEADVAIGDNLEGSEFLQIVAGYFFAWAMLTFLMLFVVPTFEVMFTEFGLVLPAPTLLLIAASKYVSLIFALGLPVIAVYLALRWRDIHGAFETRFSPLATGGSSLPASLSLRCLLGIVAQSKRPFATGLSTLAHFYQKPSARSRLTRACERIQQGQEPWTSLAAEKLLSKPEARALSVSQQGQTQAWLLGWSITRRQNRRRSRVQLFAKTISCICTIILGFLVAFTVIYLFMPLVELISGLT